MTPSSTLNALGLGTANPHRVGTSSHDRFERVRGEMVEAAEIERQAVEARKLAKEVVGSLRLPPGFDSWGVMRVRAWRRAVRRLRGLATKTSVSAVEMMEAIEIVRQGPPAPSFGTADEEGPAWRT